MSNLSASSPSELPGPKRPDSDAFPTSDEFSLDAFYWSMCWSTLHEPWPVTLLARPWLLDESKQPPEDDTLSIAELPTIVVQLVITNIRVVHTVAQLWADGLPDRYEYPEYEFDAWLLGDCPEKIWIRGALRTNDTRSIQECTLYRLKPGEELGTDRTPGIY